MLLIRTDGRVEEIESLPNLSVQCQVVEEDPVFKDIRVLDGQCRSCHYLEALRVDRSYSKYRCGCRECSGFGKWTCNDRLERCGSWSAMNRAELMNSLRAWKLSADQIMLYWKCNRLNVPYDGELADDATDTECGPILRPAPIVLGQG